MISSFSINDAKRVSVSWAYARARGEAVEEACVRIYEDKVRMTCGSGGDDSDLGVRKAATNVGLSLVNWKTG